MMLLLFMEISLHKQNKCFMRVFILFKLVAYSNIRKTILFHCRFIEEVYGFTENQLIIILHIYDIEF